MIESVSQGRDDTAMASFSGILSADEIEMVVDFVRAAFMNGEQRNTRYHTAANGWPNHDQFSRAFPFANGEIALDVAVETLTAQQQQGRRLFMQSCITCHDRARVLDEGAPWDSRAVSYPRGSYSHRQPDAISGATPYSAHDKLPLVDDLNQQQQLGETLFQANCAFCHAADGSGKNWIGSFLESQPRDLTDAKVMQAMTTERLQEVIRNGLPETSMPAWRHVLSATEIEAVASYVMKVFVGLKKSTE